MGIQLNAGCATLLKIGTGSSDALEELGYSIDGFNLEERVFKEDIHSDENGGTAGPPVDIMIHGQIDVITFDAVRIDPIVAAKVQFVKGTSAGVVPSSCVLLFGDSKSYRVLLIGTNFTRNYLRVVISQKNLGRIGAHASVFRYTLECHMDPTARVLWNTTTA